MNTLATNAGRAIYNRPPDLLALLSAAGLEPTNVGSGYPWALASGVLPACRKAHGLPDWFEAELKAERPERWLAERGLPTDAAHYIFQCIVWLFGALAMRHLPLPHYRTMNWAGLMEWLGDALRAYSTDEGSRTWERREVLYQFGTGWTVEVVSTEADFEREGLLMKNCLAEERFDPTITILSLRDQRAMPHANLSVVNRELVGDLQGRCVRWPKERYVQMLHEFICASGLELSSYAAGLFQGAGYNVYGVGS